MNFIANLLISAIGQWKNCGTWRGTRRRRPWQRESLPGGPAHPRELYSWMRGELPSCLRWGLLRETKRLAWPYSRTSQSMSLRKSLRKKKWRTTKKSLKSVLQDLWRSKQLAFMKKMSVEARLKMATEAIESVGRSHTKMPWRLLPGSLR